MRHLREVRSFREELAEEPVGVLVAPPLPRCVRVDEIHRHAERRLDALVTAELLAPVRRRRLERAFREGAVHRMDRPFHRGRGAVRDRQGEIEPALPLDERRDARLRFPTSGDDGVELPMPECPATPDLWRSFRDGETDVDATARLGTFSHVVGVPSNLPREGRGLSPEPSRDGPDGHPELLIGLYFHAFRCGKMGVAHAISSV